MKVLVTGATGYIGGRLVPELLRGGHDVLCLARDPSKLDEREWRSRVEVHRGDLHDPHTLPPALHGVDVAFYLVHSMGRSHDFAAAEATAAENFADAAAEAGVGHVVYLGGLGRDDEQLSKHLASRHHVGWILARGRVPVTELRAATVIGTGSLSFEMLRYLTEVLPVMTTPRWVRSMCQPIAIDDLLAVMSRVTGEQPDRSRIMEIGGPDVLSYEQMMRVYAEEAGLRSRLIIPVPVLSPGLSSMWVGLVTPVPPAEARPLVDSLRHDVVVDEARAGDLGSLTKTPFREAVRRALSPMKRSPVAEGDPGVAADTRPEDPPWSGGTLFVDHREVATTADPEELARAFMRIGGDHGYYVADWAWRLRGGIDQLIGGPGLRQGRAHPERLEPGEAVDFWRVAESDPGHRLLLRAEMKLPGEAWLEFRAEPAEAGSRLVQTAYFRPRGLFGRLYWWVLVPAHLVIFEQMARRIAASVESS